MRLLTIPGVFRPRSDSRLLAGLIAQRVSAGESVLDPFTGTGILAIAAAKRGAVATALDISRRAVLCARLNARLNGVRVQAVRASDLGRIAPAGYDAIVANPPYVPSPKRGPRGAARAWEAGPEGRRFIDRTCVDASRHLRAGGRLLMVHSSVCGEAETLERLRDRGLRAEVVERHRGPVGPLMAAAAATQGVEVEVGEEEEILVFEAVAV